MYHECNVEKKERDLSLIPIDESTYLVIACDSAGGIGPKEHDLVKVPAEVIGAFTARVALMEVLSVGAKPVSLVNTLAVEYEPTGKGIIAGIRAEMGKISLDCEKILNGSTEENIPISQTGLGVTVIGKVAKDQLKMRSSQPEDLLVAIGVPLVGDEVLSQQENIADLSTLQQLLSFAQIHEIIPVGSHGIFYEASLLARMARLKLKLNKKLQINLEKSAGPATVLLLTLPVHSLNELRTKILKPIHIVGKLIC